MSRWQQHQRVVGGDGGGGGGDRWGCSAVPSDIPTGMAPHIDPTPPQQHHQQSYYPHQQQQPPPYQPAPADHQLQPQQHPHQQQPPPYQPAPADHQPQPQQQHPHQQQPPPYQPADHQLQPQQQHPHQQPPPYQPAPADHQPQPQQQHPHQQQPYQPAPADHQPHPQQQHPHQQQPPPYQPAPADHQSQPQQQHPLQQQPPPYQPAPESQQTSQYPPPPPPHPTASPPLPPGWHVFTDPGTSRAYYAHPSSGQTSWTPPPAGPPPPPPPRPPPGGGDVRTAVAAGSSPSPYGPAVAPYGPAPQAKRPRIAASYGLRSCGMCRRDRPPADYTEGQLSASARGGFPPTCRDCQAASAALTGVSPQRGRWERERGEFPEQVGAKRCAGCGRVGGQSYYSARQWKRRPGTGKCLACWERDEKIKGALAATKVCTFCNQARTQEHFTQTQWVRTAKTAAQRTCKDCTEAKVRATMEKQMRDCTGRCGSSTAGGGSSAAGGAPEGAQGGEEAAPAAVSTAGSGQDGEGTDAANSGVRTASVPPEVAASAADADATTPEADSGRALEASERPTVSAAAKWPEGDRPAQPPPQAPQQQQQQWRQPPSKKCLDCGHGRSQDEFSKTQWKKRSGTGRCVSCVSECVNPTQAAEIAFRGERGTETLAQRREAAARVATAALPVSAATGTSRGAEEETATEGKGTADGTVAEERGGGVGAGGDDWPNDEEGQRSSLAASPKTMEESPSEPSPGPHLRAADRYSQSVRTLRRMKCERYDLPGRVFEVEEGEDLAQPLPVRFETEEPTDELLVGSYDVVLYYGLNVDKCHSRTTRGALTLTMHTKDAAGAGDGVSETAEGEGGAVAPATVTTGGELRGTVTMHPSLSPDIVPFGGNFSFVRDRHPSKRKNWHVDPKERTTAGSVPIKVVDFPSPHLRDEFQEDGGNTCTGSIRVVAERTAGGWNPDESSGRNERRVAPRSVDEADRMVGSHRREILSRSWLVARMGLPESAAWLTHEFVAYRPPPAFFVERGDLWVRVDWTLDSRTPCESVLVARRRRCRPSCAGAGAGADRTGAAEPADELAHPEKGTPAVADASDPSDRSRVGTLDDAGGNAAARAALAPGPPNGISMAGAAEKETTLDAPAEDPVDDDSGVGMPDAAGDPAAAAVPPAAVPALTGGAAAAGLPLAAAPLPAAPPGATGGSAGPGAPPVSDADPAGAASGAATDTPTPSPPSPADPAPPRGGATAVSSGVSTPIRREETAGSGRGDVAMPDTGGEERDG